MELVRAYTNSWRVTEIVLMGIPGGSSGKESACQCRRCKRRGFDPWVEKISWSRHGNPLQYSCLENLTDSRAWWATAHGVAQSRTQLKQLPTWLPKKEWKVIGEERNNG